MVELRLDGKPLGRARPKEYRAVFKTEYQPGTLTAVALDEAGNTLAETSLTTAGVTTQLCAIPEKTRLRANGQDLCYLPIELTDENGNLKPAKDVRVCVEVKGAASLQGLGSGLERTDEVFDKPHHHTHLGRALAILRAGYTPGKAVVSVSAEGMPLVQVEIMVE